MVQLPPEVYGVIASYVNTRDLLTLARTTKALQRAAEPRIYESVMFRDAQTAYHGCHALTLRDGLRALYVKRFVLYQDPRRASARNNLTAVPAQFWLTIQLALTLAVNLDTLVLWDPLAVHSWVLDHEQIRFQLREANLRLPWDAHLVAFLEKQDKLQALNACDGPGDDDDGGGGPLCPLPPTALGALESFSGPVLVVAELFGCPLTRVQIFLDDDTAPILPTVAGDLGRIMKGLRSLSVVNLPAGLLLETVQLVSTSVFASTIRYLGVLPLSSTEVSCPSPRSRSRPCFSGYSYLDAVHRVDAASPRSGPGRLELESVNSNSRARATRTRKLAPPFSSTLCQTNVLADVCLCFPFTAGRAQCLPDEPARARGARGRPHALGAAAPRVDAPPPPARIPHLRAVAPASHLLGRVHARVVVPALGPGQRVAERATYGPGARERQFLAVVLDPETAGTGSMYSNSDRDKLKARAGARFQDRAE